MSIRNPFLVYFLMLFLANNNIHAQLNSFENIVQYGESGFFKNGIKGFFKGFADFG